jgi:hypothetical protein
MSDRFLRDNAADRALGKVWEQRFCALAAWYGKALYAYQIDRGTASRWQKGSRWALTPDVQIFTGGGESHEVKHKQPTIDWTSREPRYGWEAYRLAALVNFQQETRQSVFYTIHNWKAAGAHTATESMPNVVQDWYLVTIEDLNAYRWAHLTAEPIDTWIAGVATRAQGYYWPASLWQRLDLVWGLPE